MPNHLSLSRRIASLSFLIGPALLASTAQGQIIPALSSQVCTSPSFGARILPGQRGNPQASKCTGSAQTEIFWVPATGDASSSTSCPPPTGNLQARMPVSARRLVLLNLDARRVLTAIGTTGNDILVGSPASSDVLEGDLGKNTYIVGGLDGVLLGRGANDQVMGVSTSGEIDTIRFGADDEYIYINPGSGGQANPGSISSAAGAQETVRGADAVPLALRPSASPCVSSLSPWLRPSGEVARLALAGIPPTAASPLLLAQPLGVAGELIGPTGGRHGSHGPSPRCQDIPAPCMGQGFPGAPRLVGFGLQPDNTDRIFVPAASFSFLGTPINQAFPPGKPIPVLVVDSGRFTPPRLVSAQELKRLQARASGLSNVRSDVAPLVYFRQNGLLVFSRNSEPLGSKNNPGIVIAQLLDRNSLPLKLPVASAQEFYLSNFLTFTPPQKPKGSDMPR